MYITITSLFTITEHWQNAITRLNIGITRITRLNIVTLSVVLSLPTLAVKSLITQSMSSVFTFSIAV